MDNPSYLSNITDLYDNLTYFDVYGTQLIIFSIITFFVISAFTTAMLMSNMSNTKDNWAQNRCRPTVIPFAGFIQKNDDQTVFQATKENFDYCLQNLLKTVTSKAVQPLEHTFAGIQTVLENNVNAVQNTRNVLASIRSKISSVMAQILGKVYNVLIPLQQMFISFQDTLGKSHGIMMASLLSTIGAYQTMKSLFANIVALIIKVLITLSVIIIGLWSTPFTFPAAASATAVFLSISIPLGIITAFLSKTMHIHSSGIPKLRCFGKYTPISLAKGVSKPIYLLQVGDVLENGSICNATMELNAEGVAMYDLYGVIVSGTHMVFEEISQKWMRVCKHPFANKVKAYNEKTIYCFNTTSKEIWLNGLRFTDWDELFDESLASVLRNAHLKCVADIEMLNESYVGATYINIMRKSRLTGTLEKQAVQLREVQLKDKIGNDEISPEVYGIVQLKNGGIHLLTHPEVFVINGGHVHDYNFCVDKWVTK